MHWKEEDFKVTKFSLKLLEILMKKGIKKKLSIGAVFGVPFHEFIEELNYKNVDISEYLTPLPGLS